MVKVLIKYEIYCNPSTGSMVILTMVSGHMITPCCSLCKFSSPQVREKVKVFDKRINWA